MKIKITVMLLFSLLLTNMVIADQDISWYAYLNPFNLCKKIKNATVNYGAGQQALEQVKAQQQIIELLAKNPQNSACAEQLERIAALSKETNTILQAGVDSAKNTSAVIAASVAVGTALTLSINGYKFYKWMWPSYEEIRNKKLQNERNDDELEFLLTKAATRCFKYNNLETVNIPERINRCNQVFADYSRFVGVHALTDLKKSVTNDAA